MPFYPQSATNQRSCTPKFLDGFNYKSKGEDNNQEKIGRGEKEEKEKNSRVWIRDARQRRCSHSILEKGRTWFGHGISLRSYNDFHLDHPN
jgi:hypothetical protein